MNSNDNVTMIREFVDNVEDGEVNNYLILAMGNDTGLFSTDMSSVELSKIVGASPQLQNFLEEALDMVYAHSGGEF